MPARALSFPVKAAAQKGPSITLVGSPGSREDATMIRSQALASALLGVTMLLAALSSTGCQNQASSSPEDSEAKRVLTERLELASARGREIHRRDMLGWWASDLAQLEPSRLAAVTGWLLDADDSSAVHFTIEGEAGPATTMIVRCPGSGPESCATELFADPRPLSDRNLAQVRAVATAAKHPEFSPTSERYNHAVLPAEGSRWWVYLIAATTDPNLIMLGRHYRFLVSAAGDEVLEWQAFSKSALTIDARPSADAGPATTVEFTVTHMLDDIPSEMHVWAALNYRTSIDVVTGDERIWRVAADGSITQLERRGMGVWSKLRPVE